MAQRYLGSNRRERQSGAYHPFIPDTLCSIDHLLTPEAANAAAKAQMEIQKLDSRSSHLVSAEPLARLILRAEALASSKIEGLQMNAGRLPEYEALDELGISHQIDGTEAAVLGNIASMEESIAHLSTKGRLDVSDLCSINSKLLENTDEASFGGCIRTQQNSIGGNNVNPIGAAYVPPPEMVPALLEDLVCFINASPLPPVAIAAMAHAQLETIHPFADGNGRTGRTLIQVILRRTGVACKVSPPISLILATDKSRYISNLAAWRMDEESQDPASRPIIESDWVEYFSRAMTSACRRAQDFDTMLGQILDGWQKKVRLRAGSAAALLLPQLLANPVVSIASAARLTNRSDEAARNAVATLCNAEILKQNSRNRKSSLFVATDVLDAFTFYERGLVSPAGDTAAEKPSRPAPQKPRH